jgi:hypothetical protein
LFDYEALDPNYKLAYVEEKWEQSYVEDARGQLEDVVRVYIPSLYA